MGKAKRGKGTKLMVLADGKGTPLGILVEAATPSEVRLLERTLDTAGTIVNQRTVGNVLNLSTVRETTGAGGQILRQVRDTSGAVIELTLDAAGRVTNSRVVSQATGTTPRQ